MILKIKYEEGRNMKKILHVVPCLAKGGTEAFIMMEWYNISRVDKHPKI